MTLLTEDQLRAGQGFGVHELRRFLKDGALQDVRGPNWPLRKALVDLVLSLQITVEEVAEWRRTKRPIARFIQQGNGAGGSDDGEEEEMNEGDEEEEVVNEGDKEEVVNEEHEEEVARDVGSGIEEDPYDDDETISAPRSPSPTQHFWNSSPEYPYDSDFDLRPLTLEEFRNYRPPDAGPPSVPYQNAAASSSYRPFSTGFIYGLQNQVPQAYAPAPPPPPSINRDPQSHVPAPAPSPSALDPLAPAPFDPNVSSLVNSSRNPWYPFENRADAEEADPFRLDSFGVFERNEGKD